MRTVAPRVKSDCPLDCFFYCCEGFKRLRSTAFCQVPLEAHKMEFFWTPASTVEDLHSVQSSSASHRRLSCSANLQFPPRAFIGANQERMSFIEIEESSSQTSPETLPEKTPDALPQVAPQGAPTAPPFPPFHPANNPDGGWQAWLAVVGGFFCLYTIIVGALRVRC